ncbi:glycosyltransferase family 2 protein [Candidatus Woesearchaeota archaeon]|nr:glycosyltransferase family 2 protein [Candidatus Woesearchaeota archaeon]
MANPKVLVAFPTYDGQKYCLEPFLEGINNLDYDNFDILAVDNSETDEYFKHLQSKGVPAMRDAKEYPDKFEKIRGSRKMIKNIFLKGDYQYLLYLDSDVIVPKDAIKQLLSRKKDIVSGVYLNGMRINGKPGVFPVLYDFVSDDPEDKRVKLMTRNDVMPEKFKEIACGGMGCVLVSRAVLVDTTFDKIENTTDDVSFFLEARKLGFRAYVDTSVKCNHINYPLDDKRNMFFDWNYYKNR